MAAEDVALIDASIGKKPIGRLGVRPVLAGIRDALAHAVAELLQKLAKSSAKTRIFESGFVDLALSPMLNGVSVSDARLVRTVSLQQQHNIFRVPSPRRASNSAFQTPDKES